MKGSMSTRARSGDGKRRAEPPAPDAERETGYDAWLEAELEAGCAELDAGRGVAAERAWKELGLE